MNASIPYKLSNRVQRYAWGKHGQDSLIHRLLGSNDTGTLAAELWIGAHSSAPSELITEKGNVRLDEAIARQPNAWLGERVVQKFGASLPYLFKVLSVRTALSIQAHPDKQLAAELHAADPVHYPDANHKPEMAIAVTDVEVLYGFREIKEIQNFFSIHKPLEALLSPAMRKRLLESSALEGDRDLLRDLCFEIFHATEGDLRKCTSELTMSLRSKTVEAPEERWFLSLSDEYPGDVGLLCFFLLNFISMKPGEALFVGPNTPHAYLRGDLLECMASSDNVVRAGLTNKYKDVETLLKMLHFRTASAELIVPVPSREGKNAWRYPAPALEFFVELLSSSSAESWALDNQSAAMLFCFEGKGKLESANDHLAIGTGEAIFVPATCPPVTLASPGGKFYHVHVPH